MALGILPPPPEPPDPPVIYPVPLREGWIAHIHNLPPDLTPGEAEYIGRVITALASKTEYSQRGGDE